LCGFDLNAKLNEEFSKAKIEENLKINSGLIKVVNFVFEIN
jgi:hypothetical protein